MGDRLSCWDECKLPQLNLFSSNRWGLSFCFHDKGSILKLSAGNEFRKHVSIFAEKTTFGVGNTANSPAQDWNQRRCLKPHALHRKWAKLNPAFSLGVNLMLLFSRLRLASLKVSNSKGWLAIAKLKPLSLFISLFLMLKKAPNNVKIEKWKVKA